MDEIKIRELVGANMDIDLVSDNVDWNTRIERNRRVIGS